MDTPIACSLTPADLAARRALTASIARRALRSRAAIPGGERLLFDAADGVEDDLRAVIAAEAECCPFLEFSLDVRDDVIELVVRGPAEAAPIIEYAVRA